MPHHAKAAGWTTVHTRRWFTHCDQCGTRRLVADYYEVYPPLDSKGDKAGWWWACSWCLLDIISSMLEDTLKQIDDIMQEREDRITDTEAINNMMAMEETPPCKRVSVCCEKEAMLPPFISACNQCCRVTEFKCLACGDLWPDREGKCLGQENLDGS